MTPPASQSAWQSPRARKTIASVNGSDKRRPGEVRPIHRLNFSHNQFSAGIE
jgi:hypothetical protein